LQANYWWRKAANQGHVTAGCSILTDVVSLRAEAREKAVFRAMKAKFILVLALVIAVVALVIKFIAG
jgi:hypothetical protein